MKKTLQTILQLTFLLLFLFLFVKGKVQLWMGLFLLSIIVSFLLGRLYCGWVCPINSVLKGVVWIKSKLNIGNIKIPTAIEKPWIRFLALGIFITLFIFIMATGKKLPVLPALFIIGVLLTFLFPEELWHRYLCPYGTILNISSIKAKHTMVIDSDVCNNCGLCKRICPAHAVEKNHAHYNISKRDCLVCMKCAIQCKQNAIHYE